MGRSRQKLPERRHPLTCPPRILNLVRIDCVLPTYSGKIDFFRPEKSLLSAYKYGFKIRIKFKVRVRVSVDTVSIRASIMILIFFVITV